MPKRRNRSKKVKKDSIRLRQRKKIKLKEETQVIQKKKKNDIEIVDVRTFAETFQRSKESTTTKKKKKKKKIRMGEVATVKAVSEFVRTQSRPLLLSLRGLIRAKMVRRPSARNRSPYVGDILLEDGREAIAHMPCMDMGGKCREGANLLVRVATDAKGQPVGKDAVSKKYGTPKCEFITQLLWNDEDNYKTWIVAHPRIGETLAETICAANLVNFEQGPVVSYEREVRKICGTNMRSDFVLTHENKRRTVMEVKTVVDTDFESRKEGGPKIQFVSKASGPYRRSAIFPWGRSSQKGPDGEKVVSARAIKHVDELARIQTGELKSCEEGKKGESLNSSIMFVCGRSDVKQFRPNADACPSFASHLKTAHEKGVQVFAHRIRWGVGSDDEGKAWWDGEIPVVME